MNETEATYILDTSALLTLIEDEAGADVVQNVLESAISGNVQILVSFMSFMEVFYITVQESDIEEAQRNHSYCQEEAASEGNSRKLGPRNCHRSGPDRRRLWQSVRRPEDI
jgi:PIN domain nuclease of toxin-antitoxin system